MRGLLGQRVGDGDGILHRLGLGGGTEIGSQGLAHPAIEGRAVGIVIEGVFLVGDIDRNAAAQKIAADGPVTVGLLGESIGEPCGKLCPLDGALGVILFI